jgi:hypothetical protein
MQQLMLLRMQGCSRETWTSDNACCDECSVINSCDECAPLPGCAWDFELSVGSSPNLHNSQLCSLLSCHFFSFCRNVSVACFKTLPTSSSVEMGLTSGCIARQLM